MIPSNQRGFSLLEVVVALSILSLSLVVLLQAQGQGLNNASVSRDVSMATLLARSKMVDVEQKFFQEGFVQGELADEGDFREEGFEHIRWKTKVTPVQLDLSALTDLCSQVAPKAPSTSSASSSGGKPTSPADECGSMLGSLSGMLQNFTQEIGDSMRACELVVSWSEGRFERKIVLRSLLTKDDYATMQQGDTQKTLDRSGLGQPGVSLPTQSAGQAPTTP